MNSSDTRVQTYLDDLARMLSDLDPGERDDVLAGIREHLDAEIGSGDGGAAAVQAALLRLGPPEAVAAEARRGAPASPGTGAPAASANGGAWARVAVVTTLLSTLPFLAAAMAFRLADAGASAGPGWPQDVGLFGPTGAELSLLMPLASPLWVIGLVCTLAAPPLRRRTRLGLALVGPAAFAVVNIAALWGSPVLLSAIVSAALALATGLIAIAIGRRAWREASA